MTVRAALRSAAALLALTAAACGPPIVPDEPETPGPDDPEPGPPDPVVDEHAAPTAPPPGAGQDDPAEPAPKVDESVAP